MQREKIFTFSAGGERFFNNHFLILPTCNPDPSHLVAEREVARGVRISPSLGSTELGVGLIAVKAQSHRLTTKREAPCDPDKPRSTIQFFTGGHGLTPAQ